MCDYHGYVLPFPHGNFLFFLHGDLPFLHGDFLLFSHDDFLSFPHGELSILHGDVLSFPNDEFSILHGDVLSFPNDDVLPFPRGGVLHLFRDCGLCRHDDDRDHAIRHQL